ncbi:MAG: hypothetical protein AABW50_05625 [Nanoarchaeota archaeon]
MNNVFIPDENELEKKLNFFVLEGADSIHVVSDFDRTLTYATFGNQKTPSLISHLRNGNYLTSDYAERAQKLADKYHPIEINSNISIDEKKKDMSEWWKSHYELLAECGLDEETMKKAVRDLVKEGRFRLRKGTRDFFGSLHEEKIPLIIMSSAGIGNMVTDFLDIHGLYCSNVHFIGNTLDFDSKGKFRGIEDNKIIHSFNKNEIEIKGLPVYDEISKRRNVLLLGDSLGDLKMAEGFPYKNLLKIGFFNPGEEDFEHYADQFDVLIKNDGDFSYVNFLLKNILR